MLGSPPGYWIRHGDPSLWVIHLQGGAWCIDNPTCVTRCSTPLGSSLQWNPLLDTTSNSTCQTSNDGYPSACCCNGGFISDNPSDNPMFAKATMVFVGYCDGTSFASERSEPIIVVNSTTNASSTLYFKGQANLQAVFEDLFATTNLSLATDVILTGCSAGGMSTYLQLDNVRAILPSSINLYGLADAGFFLEYPTYSGISFVQLGFMAASVMWNVTAYGTNKKCVEAYSSNNNNHNNANNNNRRQIHYANDDTGIITEFTLFDDTYKCLFPQYVIEYTETPLFALQGQYDGAQLGGLMMVPCITRT